MLHVLSTHGLMLTFNLLNLMPNAPGLCSPPQPIGDYSGLHLFKEESTAPSLYTPQTVTPPTYSAENVISPASSDREIPRSNEIFSPKPLPRFATTPMPPKGADKLPDFSPAVASTPAKPFAVPAATTLPSKSLFSISGSGLGASEQPEKTIPGYSVKPSASTGVSGSTSGNFSMPGITALSFGGSKTDATFTTSSIGATGT